MTERISGHVVVLGLGRSGRAVAEHAASLVATGDVLRVTALDAGISGALTATAESLGSCGCAVALETSEVPRDADLIVASPGLPPASPLMRSARASGAPVISEIEYAYRISRSPWVAITGTNGKTTTTSLVAHLLTTAGVPAEPVGNIGRPATTVAAQAGPATVLVAEVSSFQLASIERFRPRVAVLLNITPDHVDWHGSLERYEADKVRVFENQGLGDVAVVDVDDPVARRHVERIAARGVTVRRVSVRTPQAGGAYLAGEDLVLDADTGPHVLCTRGDLMVRGSHNVSNALAAAAAAYAAGAGLDGVRTGLRTFRPIEHRLEPAGVANGVEYVNDSKGTNTDAVLKALTAFEGQRVIVLLGGSDKGGDFAPLARAVAAECAGAVLFGGAGPKIESAFEREAPAFPVVRAARLADAVREGARLARPGDVVLLSPACASFDEFENYEHRGRVFKELVAALAQDVRS